jgi:hypothetical protein
MKFVHILSLLLLFSFSKSVYGFDKDSSSVPNKPIVFKKYIPYRDSISSKIILRNQEAPFGRKLLRASGLVFSVEATTYGLLFALPMSISKWDKTKIDFGANYKMAFTHPPVVDKDLWYINYLGHPYQGAYTYNAIRSQGAKIWQSSLFTIGHSIIWEYGIEAGLERPSIQDLIVTPGAGILLGELFHFSTCAMAKNGFKWYEIAFVCIFNPMYAINNGFSFAQTKTIAPL